MTMIDIISLAKTHMNQIGFASLLVCFWMWLSWIKKKKMSSITTKKSGEMEKSHSFDKKETPKIVQIIIMAISGLTLVLIAIAAMVIMGRVVLEVLDLLISFVSN